MEDVEYNSLEEHTINEEDFEDDVEETSSPEELEVLGIVDEITPAALHEVLGTADTNYLPVVDLGQSTVIINVSAFVFFHIFS